MTEKTQNVINNQLLSWLNVVAKDLYEVKLVQSFRDNREPIKLGVFILGYVLLECWSCIITFSINKLDQFEMDTDSFYLAVAEQVLDE